MRLETGVCRGLSVTVVDSGGGKIDSEIGSSFAFCAFAPSLYVHLTFSRAVHPSPTLIAHLCLHLIAGDISYDHHYEGSSLSSASGHVHGLGHGQWRGRDRWVAYVGRGCTRCATDVDTHRVASR